MDIEQIETDIESLREEILNNLPERINIPFIETLLNRIEENLKPSDNNDLKKVCPICNEEIEFYDGHVRYDEDKKVAYCIKTGKPIIK